MNSPAPYEIRVSGALDQSWCELAEDMTLTVAHEQPQTITVLRVTVPDQAALAGVLDALFSLNVTVLSVEALEAK